MLPLFSLDWRKGAEMSAFFEDTYTVDSRDTDLFGQCRPSALLGFLQEAAIQAAGELGVSREEMVRQYHAFWMLSRIRYTLVRPLRCGERVGVKTWHRGGKAAVMYRDFDLYIGNEHVGEAISIWVLADLDNHKLLRLSEISQFEGTDGGALCRTEQLRKPRLPEDMVLSEVRRMHYSDTDINGHVNNGKYADFACDALALERLGTERFVSSLQLGYLAECLPGEELSLYTGQKEGEYFALGRGEEGKERFQAILTLDNLAPED